MSFVPSCWIDSACASMSRGFATFASGLRSSSAARPSRRIRPSFAGAIRTSRAGRGGSHRPRDVDALPTWSSTRNILVAIAALSIELEVDGHRADIVTRKAAQALAAHEDRPAVVIEDVEHARRWCWRIEVKPGLSGSRRGVGDIAEILRSAHDGDGATGS